VTIRSALEVSATVRRGNLRLQAASRSGTLRLQATRVALGLGVLVLWELITRLGLIESSAIVPTSEVLQSLGSVLMLPDLWSALWETLISWGIGLALCVVIGVSLGALLGSRSGVYSTVRLTLEFLRAMPPVVLIPFVLLFFGPTQEMKIILITLGAVWPLLIQVMYGVHDVDPVVSETARLYRVHGRHWVTKVILRSVTPYIMTGLRVSGVLALLLAIGSEMITSAAGLGRQIIFAQTTGAMATMYAYIVIAGVLGVGFNVLIAFADKHVLYWHPSMRGEQR
jgi:ABC-type nitrate/sulfonate/bicarbonate transport system permease component